MKIAVASDDGLSVALHTGRCKGFVIYEVAAESATRLEHRVNGLTAHARGQCRDHEGHEHGSGHHSHGPLVSALSDCRALVTRGVGPRLVADLAAHGIEACVCVPEGADEAAGQYAQGNLPRASGTGCCCHK